MLEHMHVRGLVFLAFAAATSPAAAQDARVLIARADSLYDTRQAAAAARGYEAAVAAAPESYEALWKAARGLIDLGEFERNTKHRDSLYVRGRALAERAVRANPADAEGHFHLARAVGRVALSAGVRERVRLATAVRAHALDALARNANHPGALHVLGAWHAEIRRLNGFQRVMARTFMGGEVLGEASWDSAVKYLERASAVEPERIVHRLDLGRVYADLDRPADARREFEWIARAPVSDFNDPHYKRLAGEALRALK